jgi:glyoxylase-like metal-dependent hydrolase (beta-lactamase superfamily II)
MEAGMPRAIVAVSLAAALAGPAAAQERDFSAVQVKVEKVAGSVYMLTGAGGNIGVLVGPDGVLLVDDQFAPLVPKIQAALRSITDRPVRFVLNTHWHGDHTGGNAELGRQATVIAHDNVRKRLAEGMALHRVMGQPIPPAPPEALPVVTFDQTLTVHVNGEDIRALHYARGHTDGDVIVFFPRSNVVHMGDDFVTHGFPFVDVQSGGSLRGMIENAEKAMAAVPDDVKVIPGHGTLSTKADVLRFTAALRECVGLVEKGMKEGKSLAELQAGQVLARHEALGKGFIKADAFIELVWNELRGAPAPAPSSRHH